MTSRSILKKRKVAEIEIITALKSLPVISEDGKSLQPLNNKVVKRHVFKAVLGQTCSIIDVYVASLTSGDPVKLKNDLENYAEGKEPPNLELIQLQDLVSESEQHLGFKTQQEGFMVDSEPTDEQLRIKLRWHDIAVWQLVYNLYGNEFKEMPDREKYIYAKIIKICFDTDKEKVLLFTGFLYQK